MMQFPFTSGKEITSNGIAEAGRMEIRTDTANSCFSKGKFFCTSDHSTISSDLEDCLQKFLTIVQEEAARNERTLVYLCYHSKRMSSYKTAEEAEEAVAHLALMTLVILATLVPETFIS
uniref:Uncharacterized protein LOC104223273 isoform X2 n=1 Tax=Nicotiana sylvestris TaxID=4096 RepID=A0A1U7WFH6_NICSY|nr:PREDICTED: uncharacterized protein LOC104223273 isoform X2 [Nicotiana sylvestris]